MPALILIVMLVLAGTALSACSSTKPTADVWEKSWPSYPTTTYAGVES